VKGHASNVENNRCDVLAVAAYKKPGLPVDDGYENTSAPSADL
jgi:ribonuclease HI